MANGWYVPYDYCWPLTTNHLLYMLFSGRKKRLIDYASCAG